MKAKTIILGRTAKLLAGTVLAVVAVVALGGCDRHRHRRIHYDRHVMVRPAYRPAPVVVARPAYGPRGPRIAAGRHGGGGPGRSGHRGR